MTRAEAAAALGLKPKAPKRDHGPRRCEPHRTGIAPYLWGVRWYSPGCPKCDAEVAAGRVSRTDPSPNSLKDKHAKKIFGRSMR